VSAFDIALGELFAVERGYVNDPADAGGETNFGITIAVARANGYTGSMRDMTRADAARILKSQYWDVMQLDAIGGSSIAVAAELFDTAVNCGVSAAGKILQRVLNAFNRGAADYADVQVDGVVGPMTVSAFRRFLAIRGDDGQTAILRALNSLQGALYIAAAETRPANERFVFGWFMQRIVI
jgi:lysozyme family protein